MSRRKILICAALIMLLFSLGQSLGEEAVKKEKDIYALSYLCGYKCYKTMVGKVMLQDRRFFIQGYKNGFAEALMITVRESAFDSGFQDARDSYPPKYKEDILKE